MGVHTVRIADRRRKRKTEGSKVRFGIDRAREDRLVREFQSTGDEKIFLQIYGPRIKTFEHLARRYRYLDEDMESEARTVFIKAVRGYGIGRKRMPSFNTYFYTSFLNHVKNIMKAKGRDKRRLIDGSTPESSTVSLDEMTSEDNGPSGSYHEIVASDADLVKAVSEREAVKRVVGRSWILLDLMMEAAATGIRVVKPKRFSHSVELPRGANMAAAVQKDVGLPEAMYRVKMMRAARGMASYTVTVDCRAAMEMLAGLLREEHQGHSNSYVV
jgi:hypothetical protein